MIYNRMPNFMPNNAIGIMYIRKNTRTVMVDANTLSLVDTKSAKSRRRSAPEQVILDYITNFTPLTEVEVEAIIKSLNIKHFPKGTLLLKEGQISKLCYFVLKGCVRQYYLVDGVEKTTHFYTEGQPISGYIGTFKRSKAKFFLACVDDCILTCGTPEDEARLFEQFPQFETISRLASEEEVGKSQDTLATFIINSPEERYLQLLETRPELIDRVPQYQLASYLGVTPESLSRIRKRIMVR